MGREVGFAGITEKFRKAFELFLKTLVVERVASETDFEKVASRYRMTSKNIGIDFDNLMVEVAKWMKQCVPGGNKKWASDMDTFDKTGFDLFFQYAPENIVSILKSGGQPLLNIFSDRFAKDVTASLKTINLDEYEKLVMKVDSHEIMKVYREHGYSRMPGEEDGHYISRCIMLDYRDAFDDNSLAFNIDNLISAPESVTAKKGDFTLFVYYGDDKIGDVEAPESALNEASIKAMIESVFKDAEIEVTVKEFEKQEKLDATTIDFGFELDNGECGFASIELSKPEMYKEVIEKKVVEAAKKRTYHDDVYDMLENWNEAVITAIKNKVLIPNHGQKHFPKLEKDLYNYLNGMGELSNDIADCAEMVKEDKYPAADKLQEKNDTKLAKLEALYKEKIEPFIVKYA